jgi:hypothetical protein
MVHVHEVNFFRTVLDFDYAIVTGLPILYISCTLVFAFENYIGKK